jgi:hypothetical protein
MWDDALCVPAPPVSFYRYYVSRARALRELRVSSQVKSTEYINNRQPSDAF